MAYQHHRRRRTRRCRRTTWPWSARPRASRINALTGHRPVLVGEFRKLVVKQKDGALVRLEDVANVVLGAEEYDSAVALDGNQSVFLGIKTSPDANVLHVIARVCDAFPDIQAQLPTGITGQIAYDATDFINTSIEEVIKTLIEALVISPRDLPVHGQFPAVIILVTRCRCR